MTFTESNTVEALVRDLLCGGVTHHTTVGPGLARRQGAVSGLGWHYLAPTHLPRPAHEVLVEDHVHEALLRLNPEIAAQPDRADDVLYRLRAILMGVRTDGLVKANEEFAAWLAGERSRPFGADGEHVTVRLVDFEDVERNQYVVTTQYNRALGARMSGAVVRDLLGSFTSYATGRRDGSQDRRPVSVTPAPESVSFPSLRGGRSRVDRSRRTPER